MAPQMSKQEKRRAEQEQQKQKTRILIVSTVAIVVIIFVGLFILASKDSSPAGTDSKPVAFNYSEMMRLGKEDAPVKIVEFGDFKCPACAQFTGVIKPQIVQGYVDQNKAAFYFVNLAFIGKDSRTASWQRYRCIIRTRKRSGNTSMRSMPTRGMKTRSGLRLTSW